jgi:hypothetical protein
MVSEGLELSLAVRTSLHAEYRNAAGRLCGFEVNRAITSFGVLCAALARHPNVEFTGFKLPAWYPRPARFSFKGFDYQVAIPFSDYWVGPVQAGDTHAALDELLVHVKTTVLRHRLVLRRSHYVSG